VFLRYTANCLPTNTKHCTTLRATPGGRRSNRYCKILDSLTEPVTTPHWWHRIKSRKPL